MIAAKGETKRSVTSSEAVPYRGQMDGRTDVHLGRTPELVYGCEIKRARRVCELTPTCLRITATAVCAITPSPARLEIQPRLDRTWFLANGTLALLSHRFNSRDGVGVEEALDSAADSLSRYERDHLLPGFARCFLTLSLQNPCRMRRSLNDIKPAMPG